MIIRLLCLCFAVSYAAPGLGQISTETVKINGNTVAIKKFTVECSFYIFSAVSRNWNLVYRQYSIHLSDVPVTENFQSQGFTEKMMGYYAWSDNSWNFFEKISSNELVIAQSFDDPILTTTGCVGACKKIREYQVYLSDYKRAINRNDNTMVVSSGRFRCRDIGSTYTGDCDGIFSAPEIPESQRPCKMLAYRAPPQPLGF